MSEEKHTVQAIIGSVLGLSIGIFILVVLPMSANYRRCGSVFLNDNHANPECRATEHARSEP